MTEVPKYKPTDAECAALNRQAERQKDQPAAPRFRVVSDYRGIRTELDHPDMGVAHSLLKEALGTGDDDFCRGLLAQLPGFENDGDSGSETELNFLISIIKNGKPKDELHAMLLAQMAVVHMVQMKMAQNFVRIQKQLLRIDRGWDDRHPDVIRERPSDIKSLSLLLDSTERGYNRLTRTFCMQMDASEHYRRSGEPSMTVQQLTVGSGGQAIVGNITHGTPQTAPNNAAAGPRALTDQQQSAMPSIGESTRVAVPVRRRKKQ